MMRREFAAIDALVRKVGCSPPAPRGPGDDAAVVDGSGRLHAMDTMVEGVHFRREWSSWADVGWKVFACNLSDMFAMGGEAEHFLLSVAVPAVEAREVLDGLGEGLAEARRALAPRVELLGGDLTRSEREVVVTIAMAGRVGGSVLARSGARAGMRLWVNGEPGWAAAGLALLQEGRSLPGRDAAVARALAAHRRPSPQLSLDPGVEGAAIDVSDGLVSDLWHVALASGVRLRLGSTLPGEAALLELADGDVGCVRNWQYRGGDDYCCVVAAEARPGSGFVEIGHVEDGPASVLDAGGLLLEDCGHDHFGSESDV